MKKLILIIGLTIGIETSPGLVSVDESPYKGISTIGLESVFNKYLRRSEHLKETKRLARTFLTLCRLYKFDPAEVLALIHTESSFNPKAVSRVGARGLMQVMPNTAKYIAKKKGLIYEGEKKALFNPYLNLHIGMAYLSYLRARFGDTQKYLAAYNLGPTTVGKMVRRKRFKLGKVRSYVGKIQERTPVYRKIAQETLNAS